jgi:hypothetical protein
LRWPDAPERSAPRDPLPPSKSSYKITCPGIADSFLQVLGMSPDSGSQGRSEGNGSGSGAKKRGRPVKTLAPCVVKRPCTAAAAVGEGVNCEGDSSGKDVDGDAGDDADCDGKELSIEERKRAAQKIIERNCNERLGLSWAQFLDKFKSSSEEEKKALWDSVK